MGEGLKIYVPKLCVRKFYNNKIVKKEISLLGDYLFCFHQKLSEDSSLKLVKYCRGMKYALNGYKEFQSEISDFINKCKISEDRDGYLEKNFYEVQLKKSYKFISGPFVDKIFTIIKIQQNKIDILIGDLKTTVKKQKFLFSPI